ncbi:hypothetical protein SPI_04545 [Niveomyces insectorum RCEF 264]|uniref:Uncharacterized protein n=1 Tax=Niveomyces insectorum RCEF 264 TaxID=1081102 RepID=A0A167ULC3_9HYPO|nr:hypothetical protein SPI_04545 [Niveomyces insectorum RCEF 264]
MAELPRMRIFSLGWPTEKSADHLLDSEQVLRLQKTLVKHMLKYTLSEMYALLKPYMPADPHTYLSPTLLRTLVRYKRRVPALKRPWRDYTELEWQAVQARELQAKVDDTAEAVGAFLRGLAKHAGLMATKQPSQTGWGVRHLRADNVWAALHHLRPDLQLEAGHLLLQLTLMEFFRNGDILLQPLLEQAQGKMQAHQGAEFCAQRPLIDLAENLHLVVNDEDEFDEETRKLTQFLAPRRYSIRHAGRKLGPALPVTENMVARLFRAGPVVKAVAHIAYALGEELEIASQVAFGGLSVESRIALVMRTLEYCLTDIALPMPQSVPVGRGRLVYDAAKVAAVRVCNAADKAHRRYLRNPQTEDDEIFVKVFGHVHALGAGHLERAVLCVLRMGVLNWSGSRLVQVAEEGGIGYVNTNPDSYDLHDTDADTDTASALSSDNDNDDVNMSEDFDGNDNSNSDNSSNNNNNNDDASTVYSDDHYATHTESNYSVLSEDEESSVYSEDDEEDEGDDEEEEDDDATHGDVGGGGLSGSDSSSNFHVHQARHRAPLFANNLHGHPPFANGDNSTVFGSNPETEYPARPEARVVSICDASGEQTFYLDHYNPAMIEQADQSEDEDVQRQRNFEQQRRRVLRETRRAALAREHDVTEAAAVAHRQEIMEQREREWRRQLRQQQQQQQQQQEPEQSHARRPDPTFARTRRWSRADRDYWVPIDEEAIEHGRGPFRLLRPRTDAEAEADARARLGRFADGTQAPQTADGMRPKILQLVKQKPEDADDGSDMDVDESDGASAMDVDESDSAEAMLLDEVESTYVQMPENAGDATSTAPTAPTAPATPAKATTSAITGPYAAVTAALRASFPACPPLLDHRPRHLAPYPVFAIRKSIENQLAHICGPPTGGDDDAPGMPKTQPLPVPTIELLMAHITVTLVQANQERVAHGLVKLPVPTLRGRPETSKDVPIATLMAAVARYGHEFGYDLRLGVLRDGGEPLLGAGHKRPTKITDQTRFVWIYLDETARVDPYGIESDFRAYTPNKVDWVPHRFAALQPVDSLVGNGRYSHYMLAIRQEAFTKWEV